MPKKNGNPYNHELACVHCGRPVFAKMLCRKHYSAEYYIARMPLAEPLAKRRVEPRECRVDGCERLSDHRDEVCMTHLRRAQRWGLTIEELNGWLGVGACQACGSTRRLCLDHDHAHCERGCRECIRGVLCSNCNTALGMLGDSLEGAEQLANYAHAIS